jgi:hypothetical protein
VAVEADPATTAGPGGLVPAAPTDPALPVTLGEEDLMRQLTEAVERANESVDDMRDQVEDLTKHVHRLARPMSTAAWVAVAVMWLAVTALSIVLVVEMPAAAWTYENNGTGLVILGCYAAATIATLRAVRR